MENEYFKKPCMHIKWCHANINISLNGTSPQTFQSTFISCRNNGIIWIWWALTLSFMKQCHMLRKTASRGVQHTHELGACGLACILLAGVSHAVALWSSPPPHHQLQRPHSPSNNSHCPQVFPSTCDKQVNYLRIDFLSKYCLAPLQIGLHCAMDTVFWENWLSWIGMQYIMILFHQI